MEILTITPSYSTFGYQTFQEDGNTVSCTLENFKQELCVMSNVSRLFNKYILHRLSLSIPLFSGVVYLENWAFIIIFLIFSYQSFYNSKSSNFEEDLEDEEEEKSNLI